MRFRHYILMGIAAAFSPFFVTSCTTAPAAHIDPETPPTSSGDWALTFSDEFAGMGKPHQGQWISESYNRRPNEAGPDGYWKKDRVRLDGQGHLVISTQAIANQNGDNDENDYASGMVSTKGKFEQRYGRFEIRARLPRQSGWWAAFWLFSSSTNNVDESGRDGTEIDIMEGFGWTDRIQHALHWDGYDDAHQQVVQDLTVPGIRDGFHTYALEWTPEDYTFFVDGKETWRTDAGGVSQVPAYVKITGEISSLDWAVKEGWANTIDASNFPDEYIIDWVRVYKRP